MNESIRARSVNPLFALAALLVAGVLALAGCGGSAQQTTADSASDESAAETASQEGTAASTSASTSASAASDDPYASGIHHATIEIENYGTIELALDADTAPITVANFCKLANEGFYNGLTFHRIISGFMMQGGDPLGNGTGGSDETIVGEFQENGIQNPIPHVRGTISMARSSMPDSASSQFFIVHADSSFLDGAYAGFGHVTSGMEVVDAVCADAKPIDDNGTIAPEDQPRIVAITIID